MKFPAVAALLLLLSPWAALADPWFSIASGEAEQWDVETSADQVTVRHKTGSGAGPRILILYSRSSPAYETAVTKVLSIFRERGIDAVFNAVNYKNKQDLGLKFTHHALETSADLIFAMGSESTDFLIKNFLGKKIPIVSICAKDPVLLGQIKDYESGSGSNIAFTSLNVQIETQLVYLRLLMPDLKNVGILVDSTNLSAVQTQAEPFAVAARNRGITAKIISVDDPKKAHSELREKIPPAIKGMRRTDPQMTSSIFVLTGSTAIFTEIDTINEAVGRVPVLSVVPEIVSKGDSSATISIGVSFESNAHLAAIYGLDILSGRSKVDQMKVGVVSPPDIAINFRRARQIGLKIPFSLFELASHVYDGDGNPVRIKGVNVVSDK